MVVIEYAERGQPVSDFNFGDWLCNVMQHIDSGHTFVVSTAMPIDAIRLAIVQGKIDCKDVTFSYMGLLFQANEYGAILDWPMGFADRNTAISTDILRAAMKKRRASQPTPGSMTLT